MKIKILFARLEDESPSNRYNIILDLKKAGCTNQITTG